MGDFGAMWPVALILGLAIAATLKETRQVNLCLAARSRDYEGLRIILDSGMVDPNWIPDSIDVRPALIESVVGRDVDGARILISYGADVNLEAPSTQQGSIWRPLSYAFDNRDKEMIILLVESGADPEFIYSCSLSGKIHYGMYPWGMFTAVHGAVFKAMVDGEIRKIRAGLKDVDERSRIDYNALIDRLVLFGSCEQLEEVLKLGANVNGYYQDDIDESSAILPPIVSLCRYEQGIKQAHLELLLKHGASIDAHIPFNADPKQIKCGRTGLWYATRHGNVNLVKFFLDNGASPTVSDGDGVTALMNSSRKRNIECTLMLLKSLHHGGVDLGEHVNRSSRSGISALDLSIAGGHLETIRLLLLLGAHLYGHSNLRSNRIHGLTTIYASEYTRLRTIIIEFIMAMRRNEGWLPAELRLAIVESFIRTIPQIQ